MAIREIDVDLEKEIYEYLKIKENETGARLTIEVLKNKLQNAKIKFDYGEFEHVINILIRKKKVFVSGVYFSLATGNVSSIFLEII